MGAKNKKSPSQLLRMDYDINKNKIGYRKTKWSPSSIQILSYLMIKL
jgi:hypothetical protein